MQPTPVMYPYVHHLLPPLLFLRVAVVSPLMDVLDIWHDVCFHDEISQVAGLRPLGKGGVGGWGVGEGLVVGWLGGGNGKLVEREVCSKLHTPAVLVLRALGHRLCISSLW